ncbi:uncharacterized protein [Parasteatoda tepidariorum]|uniref:uncharacterized protein n=1 Tax=Parasteatoda tepidariorum TaxID=114398 RepID=UPI00077F91FE|nr:uncharacterized protein LOC107449589 isoform X1 [Parasteatoda tepidariorum]
MAAVAVAKLDVLSSHIKQERLRPAVKLVRSIRSKDEKRKRETVEDARKKLPVMKKKVKENVKVKRQSSSEADKEEALRRCLKTVKVAKNQLNDGLILQLKKLYHLPLESYESQSLEFLKVRADSQTLDLWFLSEHLKKYDVVAKQMIIESVNDYEYQESLKETKNQINQVMAILEFTAMWIANKFSPETGYPPLPDELKAGSSRSRRQNRDYLFVKEYKNFLDIIEEFLKNY